MVPSSNVNLILWTGIKDWGDCKGPPTLRVSFVPTVREDVKIPVEICKISLYVATITKGFDCCDAKTFLLMI